jgi:naringenin degradation protein FdeH
MTPSPQKVLLIDIDSCVRCYACEIACRQEHDLTTETGASWCRVATVGPRWIDGKLHLDFVPLVCQHCDHPVCRTLCPSGAIQKDCQGRVVIDEGACTGCKLCVYGCPYGCMSFNEVRRTAGHCDLCVGRTEAGLEPACVQHCIGGALHFVGKEEIEECTSGQHTLFSGRICYASSRWRLQEVEPHPIGVALQKGRADELRGMGMGAKIRRVVTGHDDKGQAVVLMDGQAGNVRFREATGITSTLLWVTDSTPADLSGFADAADRDIGVAPPPNGSVFRIVEFPPEKQAGRVLSNEEMIKEMGLAAPGETGVKPRHPAMHRTESLDYGVVLSGEIDMLLDASEVHLKAGDVVIQRGTNHAWVNRGNDPCRVAFILIGAKR